MKYINFIAPVHQMNEGSRTRVWLGFTSAVAIIIVFAAWFLSPSQVMQPEPFPGSQLAAAPGDAPGEPLPVSVTASHFRAMPPAKISESLQRVHKAMSVVAPGMLELITVKQSGGETRLTFKAIAEGDSLSPDQVAPVNRSTAHAQQLERILVALNAQQEHDHEAWIEQDSKGSPQIHFKML